MRKRSKRIMRKKKPKEMEGKKRENDKTLGEKGNDRRKKRE